MIHPAKSLGRLYREDVDHEVGGHQDNHKRIEPLALLALRAAEVGHESYHQDGHQGDLWYHVQELTIIDFHDSASLEL